MNMTEKISYELVRTRNVAMCLAMWRLFFCLLRDEKAVFGRDDATRAQRHDETKDVTDYGIAS